MLRRIRKFRVACAHEEHARHGRVRLEDALRTATLADEGRLVIVRKLALGPLPWRASATEWSRRLEQTYRGTRVEPVRFDQPAAATAEAVYFSNPHEPWLVLAERVAARRPCPEWYWRSALPTWQPESPVSETLRLCFRTLARHGGLRSTLIMASRLRATDSLTILLRALQREDVTTLAPELGDSGPASASAPESTPEGPHSASASFATLTRLSELEISFLRDWGPHDPRTSWLVAAALGREGSPVATLPSPARLQQEVRQWQHALATNRAPASVSAAPAPRATIRPPSRPAVDEPAAERIFTQAGGLFFLVPLLARAGLPEFTATLSDEERERFPWDILRLALRHARVADTDPLVVALRDLPRSTQRPARWLLAVHRLSLRLSGLGLRALITRPALVSLSFPHLDVFFRPSDADLHIRRCGLDIDPGWVPWLGRIVAYHYNRDA